MENCKTFYKRIIELTCGEQEIVIDEYQRNYVWGDKQAVGLVKSIENSEGNLFIGNIITYRVGDRFQLVDGQQRLTTFLMILKALMDTTPNNEVYRKTCDEFLKNRYNHCPYVYKKSETKEAFNSVILNNELDTCKDSRICKVYKSLKKYLSSKTEDEKARIFERIKTNVQVGYLECDSQQEAYNTFASINGLSVRVEEKYSVMCFIFQELSKNNNSSTESLLHDLHEIIENSDPSFLCRFYYNETGVWCQRQKLATAFKDFIVGRNATMIGNRIISFKNKDTDTVNYLKKNGFLTSNSTVHVLANDVLIKYADKFTDNEKLSIIKMFNAIAVRMAVTNTTCHLVEDRVAGVIAKIVGSDDVLDSLKKALNLSDGTRGRFVYASDDEFISSLCKIEIYCSSILKDYVLLEINKTLGDTEHFSIDNLSIEHIMPQSGNRGNKLLHTIGNLTITDNSKNSKLSNKPFKDKKPILKDSVIKMNRYFDALEDWNDDEIAKRSKYLANIAVNIWNIYKI